MYDFIKTQAEFNRLVAFIHSEIASVTVLSNDEVMLMDTSYEKLRLLKEVNYKACLELGHQVAKLVKKPIEKKEHCS